MNESSKYSGESDKDEINTTPLTSSFKITTSETNDNCIFLSFNNYVFGRQLIAGYIIEEIWNFIIKKKQIYEHLWKSNLNNHIIYMRKMDFEEPI